MALLNNKFDPIIAEGIASVSVTMSVFFSVEKLSKKSVAGKIIAIG